MPVSRRHALQALGLAVAGSTAMGKAWGKQAEPLRQELEACSPGGDPWTTLLERNRVFSKACLLYTSPSPRDKRQSRMPSSA